MLREVRFELYNRSNAQYTYPDRVGEKENISSSLSGPNNTNLYTHNSQETRAEERKRET